MASTHTVQTGMTVEQAFAAIVRDSFAQLLHHAAGVRGGDAPESVHQMRVGLRRLRLALRLFGRWIAVPPNLLAELRWLRVRLGAARDADVLAGGTLAALAATCPPEDGLAALQEAAAVHAQGMRQLAASAVKSARCARLMRDLSAWLQAAPWQAVPDDALQRALRQPIGPRAARMLHRRHARLVEIGERLHPDQSEERHRLRIAAKKLRYATEFFQAVRPSGHTRRFLRRLAALLDVLGGLNDAVVADLLLRDLALREPALAGSTAFARGYLCAATAQDLPALVRHWRRFVAVGPP
ncbi:CHAD domain-containing protein [Sphaerotilus montanus]|uniref:CHAD domain-containing protein n=1 Tax=Sphaerotilus montanus TaxID=522889 RepID=A0A7Y9R2Z6_9BURK|nr:CHAD domain-containing protein [Sphaerotilus montanus]NYG34583.1 CHAD domain-containing protein [Sphaerotilus montanus]NZD56677.1 CHAD domain-containing protein [Sphaerotilus montanus]